ncbi:hypothetical protein N7495_004565 [Penicillium taxi]|uniref:uncharacterized protein n=1 Tax=Penicillium taxi TaxID=168475 RepID=UPI0025455903|nr:uncharacterized protein N7495_004565 [Penicillium taxi]KAJ5899821.1 hypothetical protein N7495_004565 [Penicillium taxi]
MISSEQNFPPRARRHSPESPGSADSEEIPGHYPRERTRWAPPAPPAPGGYPQSTSSGHSFTYPQGVHPFPHQNGPSSDQLVHINGQPFNAGYPYGPQYPHGAPIHPYFAQDQAHPRHPPHQPQSRMDPHNPSQPQMPHPMAPHAPSAYPGSPYLHEMIQFPSNYFNNFRPPYPMYPGMVPQSYFPNYPQQVPSPSQPEPKSPPPPAPAEEPKEAPKDTAHEDAIARLEKLIMDERTEREDKEKARLESIQREKDAAAALEEQLAHDRKITTEAAALARADAEAKAAEDAAKAKEEASAAAAAAASEAAAAATAAATAAAAAAVTEAAAAASAATEAAASKPPAEKKKPIKFKDAVGRKFSFPFELCCNLIKQAFLHIDVIGPHVAEGHYDLVGPNGDIILPQVWDTVVEPDWSITMHMWPIPEKPKDPDPPPPPPAEEPAPAAPVKTAEPKKAATKKPARKPAEPLAFTKWMIGSRPRPKPAPKKAAEPAAK